MTAHQVRTCITSCAVCITKSYSDVCVKLNMERSKIKKSTTLFPYHRLICPSLIIEKGSIMHDTMLCRNSSQKNFFKTTALFPENSKYNPKNIFKKCNSHAFVGFARTQSPFGKRKIRKHRVYPNQKISPIFLSTFIHNTKGKLGKMVQYVLEQRIRRRE